MEEGPPRSPPAAASASSSTGACSSTAAADPPVGDHAQDEGPAFSYRRGELGPHSRAIADEMAIVYRQSGNWDCFCGNKNTSTPKCSACGKGYFAGFRKTTESPHLETGLALRDHRRITYGKVLTRHKGLEKALLGMGFGTTRADANELAEWMKDSGFLKNTIAHCLCSVPDRHKTKATPNIMSAIAELLRDNSNSRVASPQELAAHKIFGWYICRSKPTPPVDGGRK